MMTPFVKAQVHSLFQIKHDRDEAKKQVKVITHGKPFHFICKTCSCEYEAPALICTHKILGGVRKHWWSSERTPRKSEYLYECPECHTTNAAT